MAANPIEREPVLAAAVAAGLTWAAAYFGLHLDAEQAAGAAAFVVGSLVPFVRQLVRPTAAATEVTATLEHTSEPVLAPPGSSGATVTTWHTPTV
jgi:hypothetical protein